MSTAPFDTLADGRDVVQVRLGAAPGPELRVLNLGATVHGLEVTGGDGVRRQIVLAHDVADDYLSGHVYLGSTVGRYANRIRAGHLPMPDGDRQLGTHDRGHHLHGGPDGFDRRLWDVVSTDEQHVTMRLVSPDGDQGFPGEVTAWVTFTVLADRVAIDLRATTDRETVVNLTQHAYFNLSGGTGTIDDHDLTVLAGHYTPIDETGIPLGDHEPVEGTPFDLRRPVSLGAATRSGHPQVVGARGFDHNFVLDGELADDGLRTSAVLSSRSTRTTVTLRCDQPGLQVYTGNFLDGAVRGRGGRVYRQGDGIVLEPQLFPDSPHHPEWPSATLAPGQEYRARHEWVFGHLA